MGQEVTIPGDEHFAQYCNSLIPHNREETGTPTDDISQSTSTDTSNSTNQSNNHSLMSTKGKEKVGCLDPSIHSPSSSKDPKQSHYEEMDRLMKEFDRNYKMQCKGLDEYLVSLFDPPLSSRSHGKPSSTTKPYHPHFIKSSGASPRSVEEISQ